MLEKRSPAAEAMFMEMPVPDRGPDDRMSAFNSKR